MSLRTERISQQLREEIAKVLREEVTDPRVQFVTLLQVDASPDLSNAIVSWSTFDPRNENKQETKIEEIEEGLNSAAGFIRHRLAGTLNLRRMPELRFRYDRSMQLADETNDILQEIRNGKETE